MSRNHPYLDPLPPHPKRPVTRPAQSQNDSATGRKAAPRSSSLPVRALVIAALAGGVLLVALTTIALLVWYLTTAPQHAQRVTATAPPTLPASPIASPVQAAGALGLGEVSLDSSGQYAFPVAANPYQYIWTHRHWDGTNAVDIEARAGVSRADFEQLTSAELVACAEGIVYEWSGPTGGTGYVLSGDDGLDYYYAHMSELYLADGARVQPGTPLGRMGNSGGTAQFIEPHLHFVIGPRGSLQTSAPVTINAAEWLLSKFGIGWQERTHHTPPPAQPGGSPLPYPQAAIVTSYAQAQAQGLPQPALELGYQGPEPAGPLNVVATLTGVVNVIRWTDFYGTRIQINNDTSSYTVVISGVDEWLVADGELVTRGDVIARWDPSRRPTLHYMLYIDGAISDPTPTLN